MSTPLQDLVQQIERGTLRPQIGQVYPLDQIAEAHACMEENCAGGKIIVLRQFVENCQSGKNGSSNNKVPANAAERKNNP